MGIVLSAGGSSSWYRDTLAGETVWRAEFEDRDVYDLLAETATKASLGSEDLVFLPYLTG